ncbi:hypothetical protein EIN_140650 [Entamoeba invadens IP1]|uniref:Uncharacterized protein n=1 Tax=Entamoeba invadens IP1 TaxID=370355 RepID=L7FLE6_ENTIV|nr:hypothetical protein EIN_140650 [Entamoeba invadens IP1]ELP88037.1 hypothetical protein EIN_140650 [Entamoeba invadens IP1]|eukprot:XP_004254808.1 hypothetical protein EIN_140650 [Entamoeba invadens IP1]
MLYTPSLYVYCFHQYQTLRSAVLDSNEALESLFKCVVLPMARLERDETRAEGRFWGDDTFFQFFIDSMNIQSSGNFHCELFTVMALKLRLLVNKLGKEKVSLCYPEYYTFLMDVVHCIIMVQTFLLLNKISR